jgi:hypothetical protein
MILKLLFGLNPLENYKYQILFFQLSIDPWWYLWGPQLLNGLYILDFLSKGSSRQPFLINSVEEKVSKVVKKKLIN